MHYVENFFRSKTVAASTEKKSRQFCWLGHAHIWLLIELKCEVCQRGWFLRPHLV